MQIESQISRLIKTQARVNGLIGQIDGEVNVVSGLESAIETAKQQKTTALAKQGEVNRVVLNREDLVETAQQALARAEAQLQSANEALEESIRESDKYTEALFADFDAKIGQLKQDAVSADEKKEALIVELNNTREELEKLHLDLKEQGYEINIGSPRQPKTTYL